MESRANQKAVEDSDEENEFEFQTSDRNSPGTTDLARIDHCVRFVRSRSGLAISA